jgi:hypothetical protein
MVQMPGSLCRLSLQTGASSDYTYLPKAVFTTPNSTDDNLLSARLTETFGSSELSTVNRSIYVPRKRTRRSNAGTTELSVSPHAPYNLIPPRL